VVLLGLGIYAVILAYQSPPIRGGFQLSPGRTAGAPAAPTGSSIPGRAS
jgi:hypothetical protein